jgi:hypothetical protein
MNAIDIAGVGEGIFVQRFSAMMSVSCDRKSGNRDTRTMGRGIASWLQSAVERQSRAIDVVEADGHIKTTDLASALGTSVPKKPSSILSQVLQIGETSRRSFCKGTRKSKSGPRDCSTRTWTGCLSGILGMLLLGSRSQKRSVLYSFSTTRHTIGGRSTRC